MGTVINQDDCNSAIQKEPLQKYTGGPSKKKENFRTKKRNKKQKNINAIIISYHCVSKIIKMVR